MKYLVLIPARYKSSRFPGKPLAKIGGEEMILRVCRQVATTGLDFAVATDDQAIYDCVSNSGYQVVMTSSEHKSGTDRVAEAYVNLKSDADVVINVQGDEPFIKPEQIEAIKNIFENDSTAKIGTLIKEFDAKDGFDALFDPNKVKVVFNSENRALYFSRSIIPYVRNTDWKNWLKEQVFYTHIGIYGYKADVLANVVKMQQSELEKAESLEQLRWLDAGLPINVAITQYSTIGIDTPEDLRRAEEYLLNC